MSRRRSRPRPLSPAERQFRLDRWVIKHMTVYEQSGPEWTVICPKCFRPKLAVHVGRKAYQCWSPTCKFSGWSPTPLVEKTLGITRAQAAEIVASAALGLDLGPVDGLADEEAHGPRTLPEATLPPVQWGIWQPGAAQRQLSYVLGRGISREHAQLFGLGAIRSDGTGSKADRALSGRVMFPIWSQDTGRMVSWVARAIDSHPAKTINMPRSCRTWGHSRHCTCLHDEWGLPPISEVAETSEVILGGHLVQQGYPVIVVEGPVDAAVCGPGFVATLGAHLTHTQAELIAKTGASEAILLFDGDPAGYAAAAKASVILQCAIPTRVAMCPVGEDPGALGRARSLSIAHTATHAGSLSPLVEKKKHIAKPRSEAPFLAPLEKV